MLFFLPSHFICSTTHPGGSFLGKNKVFADYYLQKQFTLLMATVAAPTSIPHAFPSFFIEST